MIRICWVLTTDEMGIVIKEEGGLGWKCPIQRNVVKVEGGRGDVELTADVVSILLIDQIG